MDQEALTPPSEGTLERWAWDYVTTTSLAKKLEPPRPPAATAATPSPATPPLATPSLATPSLATELAAELAPTRPPASAPVTPSLATSSLATPSLAKKLEPTRPSAPGTAPTSTRGPVRLTAPGRPAELVVTARAEKTRGLRAPSGRARALHTFLHHELQAAELMAWAILAFPDTPPEFRDGLARITLDEARHMRLYAEHIERLGHRLGEFPVRDWFWSRIPSCATPASFVAVMGLGLESANLEHTASFAARFREAGDEAGARVQEVVGLEEIAHVRFGARWFERFTGSLDFDRWMEALPAPLTPLLMRGRPLARAPRLRGGQTAEFVDRLDAWEP